MSVQSDILSILRGLFKVLESGNSIIQKDLTSCFLNSSLGTCLKSVNRCNSKCKEKLSNNVNGLLSLQNPFTRSSRTYSTLSRSIISQQKRLASDDTLRINVDPSFKKIQNEPKREKKFKSKESKVPEGRLERLASFGNLGAGLFVGALSEMAQRSLGLGKEGKTGSILDNNVMLSEANAKRIVATLCRVRGAALKLGQMISIQDNSLINPTLQKIFEQMRQSADYMPASQMESVMTDEFGTDWKNNFSFFDTQPFGTASIGQVHLATLNNGDKVAVKIQYPGVAGSINSDIKNLLTFLKISKILPDGLYADKALKVAAKELALECDYIREGKSSEHFRSLINGDAVFCVPKVHWNLTTKRVLTTDYVNGVSLDSLENESQELRNKVSLEILRLCLDEVFTYRFMQTDPNWSNFLYEERTNKIHLIDFGAARDFSEEFVDMYIRLIHGASVGDKHVVLAESKNMGFLTGYETKIMESAHIDAVMILGEAFSEDKTFNFSKQSTAKRIHNLIPVMLKHRLTPPPEETYSLHRKMSGCFLLCAKLNANIACKQLFDRVWNNYTNKI